MTTSQWQESPCSDWSKPGQLLWYCCCARVALGSPRAFSARREGEFSSSLSKRKVVCETASLSSSLACSAGAAVKQQVQGVVQEKRGPGS